MSEHSKNSWWLRFLATFTERHEKTGKRCRQCDTKGNGFARAMAAAGAAADPAKKGDSFEEVRAGSSPNPTPQGRTSLRPWRNASTPFYGMSGKAYWAWVRKARREEKAKRAGGQK